MITGTTMARKAIAASTSASVKPARRLPLICGQLNFILTAIARLRQQNGRSILVDELHRARTGFGEGTVREKTNRRQIGARSGGRTQRGARRGGGGGLRLFNFKLQFLVERELQGVGIL